MKKEKLHRILLLATFTLCLFACKEDDEEIRIVTPKLSISQDTIWASYLEQDVSIQITSNATWHIETNKQNLVVSPEMAQGKTDVLISLPENTNKRKQYNIVFALKNKPEISQSLILIQEEKTDILK